jgi:phosphoribosylformylglycinamidine (FGAM) synthase-like enzyme
MAAILPTPTIAGVGLLPDWSADGHHRRRARRRLADRLIGGDGSHLGQSIYMRDVLGISRWRSAPDVDLVAERRNGDFVRSAIRNGQVTACHDMSDGGLAVAHLPKWRWPGKGVD